MVADAGGSMETISIMIADDDEGIVRSAERALGDLDWGDCSVSILSSVQVRWEDALDDVMRRRPSFLLLDMDFGGVITGGYQLLARLQRDGLDWPLVIIINSGSDSIDKDLLRLSFPSLAVYQPGGKNNVSGVRKIILRVMASG